MDKLPDNEGLNTVVQCFHGVSIRTAKVSSTCVYSVELRGYIPVSEVTLRLHSVYSVTLKYKVATITFTGFAAFVSKNMKIRLSRYSGCAVASKISVQCGRDWVDWSLSYCNLMNKICRTDIGRDSQVKSGACSLSYVLIATRMVAQSVRLVVCWFLVNHRIITDQLLISRL